MTADPKEHTSLKMEEPLQILNAALEDVDGSIKDVSGRIDQSKIEINKVSQRNTLATSHLQQIQIQKNLSTEELDQAYTSALDTQQRLFVMREQISKLQNDLTHLNEKKELITKLQSALVSSGDMGKSEANKQTSIELMVNAQEAERQKLSRQMHDGPAQEISNFILQTDIAIRLMESDPNQTKIELGNLKTAALNTFEKVRNFIFELRPMMLDDLGIVPTIRRYVEMFKEQTGTEVSVTITGNERRLESFLEVLLFRGMQELLGQAIHQNQATQAKVFLDYDETAVKLSLEDNGRSVESDAPAKDANLGLKLIIDRIEMLGGSWTVDDSSPLGTRQAFMIPLAAGKK